MYHLLMHVGKIYKKSVKKYNRAINKLVTAYLVIPSCDLSHENITCQIADNLGNVFVGQVAGKNLSAGNAYGFSLSVAKDPFYGHDYVDLGLKDEEGHIVYWATCNVGGENPEDAGQYFCWGETYDKTSIDMPSNHRFTWATYSLCNGTKTSLTKYCTDSSYGTVDNKETLDLEDDAAHVNWGGKWRMPTSSEIYWLAYSKDCTFTWESENGVTGYRVSSNINANASIFLPAAGYWSDARLYEGSGHYWTSSLRKDVPSVAYELYFTSEYKGRNANYGRHLGYSVRPVCVITE